MSRKTWVFLMVSVIAIVGLIVGGCASPTPSTTAPTTSAPTTAAPTTAAPTTSAPTTAAPTTSAPTTKPPTSTAPPATTTPAGKPIKLQLESFTPIGTPPNVIFHKLMDELSAATGGLVTTEYHEAGALGAPTDTLNRMQQGVTDYGVLVTGYYPGVFDLFEVFELPIHYPDTVTIQKAVNIMLKKGYFDKQLSGLVPGVIYGIGSYQLHSTKQVLKVEDFQGMKLRGPSDMYRRITETLGGVPVTLAGPELFTSMDKKIIDATWANWEMGRAFKLMDIEKYILPTQLSTSMHIQGFNLDSFKKLPPAGQDYIKKNFEANVLGAGIIWDKPHEDVRKLIYDNPKITKDVLTDAEKARLDAKLTPIIAQWIKDKEAKGLPAKQAVTDLYATLESLGVMKPFILP